MKPETRIYLQLSQWMQMQYKGVIFHFDMKLQSIGAGMLNKRINPFNGYPDLLILEPRGQYHALFIEVKKDGEKLLNRKMNYRTPHIEQQNILHSALRAKGYYCCFGIGFEGSKDIIEHYLK